mgnify:FL=1
MSRLLFITQKVDKDDDVLGVYHRWIDELAKKVEQISVICLYQGRTELPINVQVFSLRKEYGSNRWSRVFLFYKYIWILRKDYSSVFVHMNPIYILLGGLFWKLSGKRILFWYNHPFGNITARIGIALADKVFCTSPYSFSARYKKTSLMPAGVDTVFFKRDPNITRKENRILYLARISLIKNIDCLIEAAKILEQKRMEFEFLIVGSPSSDMDKIYEKRLRVVAKDLINSGRIVFRLSVPHNKTPEIYNSSGIFVNLTPAGSFDKTILEAMASELLILVSNRAFGNILGEELGRLCLFEENNVLDLVGKIKLLLALDPAKKLELGGQLRETVVQHHCLAKLLTALAAELA